MKVNVTKAVVILVALVSCCAPLAANNLQLIDSHPDGFALYRSGAPDASDLKRWCRLGIEEVVVLAGDASIREFRYRSACPSLKVVIDAKQRPQVPLGVTFLSFFDAWIEQARRENKKVLFRCVCGCHRTGRLAAYYEMKYMGRTARQALANMYRYGHKMQDYRFLDDQVRALEDWAEGRPCRFLGKQDRPWRACVVHRPSEWLFSQLL